MTTGGAVAVGVGVGVPVGAGVEVDDGVGGAGEAGSRKPATPQAEIARKARKISADFSMRTILVELPGFVC